MNRPDAATLLPVMFVPRTPSTTGMDRLTLADHAIPHLVAERRCRKARHLLAVVIRTEHGAWTAWRGSDRVGYPVGARAWDGDGSAGWECGWADETQFEHVWCPCMRSGTWVLDIRALAGLR